MKSCYRGQGQFSICLLAPLCLFAAGSARAERPRVYALKNAKIVVAPGRVIEKGTIVLRDGLIEAVGASVVISPDAVEIDASGKTIYPGLIDAYTNLGVRGAAPTTTPAAGATPAPPSRTPGAARLQLLAQRPEAPSGPVHPLSGVRPEKRVLDSLVPFEGDNNDAERYRNMGITTVLVVPEGGVFRGVSALINLKDAVPVADLLLKDSVGEHIAFESAGFGRTYPSSLMGVAATIRQVFLDADRYLTWKKRYAEHPAGMKRPPESPAFESLAGVLDGSRPVFFEAQGSQDVLLADRLAREFKLNAVIAGSGKEWELLDQIKATGRAMILPASFPDKPKVDDADEVLDTSLRDLRYFVNAPENPKRVHAAGIKFALSTHSLRNPADFPKNMKRILDAGLPPDAALAALTTVPAEMLGVSGILGTLDAGKIANLFVTDGELFGEKTKIQRIFVDGYEYKVEEPKRARGDPNAVVDPRGTWSVVFESRGGRSTTRTWTIKGAKGNYSGTAETQRGTTEFSGVKLEGNMLTVGLPGPGGGSSDVTVVITGETFEGSVEQGRMTVPIKGTRTSGPDGGAL